jgi:hypothetical protein
LLETSGNLILIDKAGATYLLKGHAAELRSHVRDELSVNGRIRAAAHESSGDYALGVVSFRTILRRSTTGVQPRLGEPRDWSTFKDKSFGVVVRHPKTFLQQEVELCCLQSNFVNPTGILTLHIWSIPREVYRGSNLKGGAFAVYVDPKIRSEGTCRQFGSTKAGYTFSKTLGGIRYSQTLSAGVGMGTEDIHYHLHTFQNGFCYEFTIEFDQANGTGMETSFCLIQWLSNDNEQELVNSLLSRVSFVTPDNKNAARAVAAPKPLVTSLEQSSENDATQIAVSWSTEGADYVQLQYRCIQQLFVMNFADSGEMNCGGPTDRNFPPIGSASLELSNFNTTAVSFVLTVVPFSDGTEYHAGSKTITMEIAPDGFQPSPH